MNQTPGTLRPPPHSQEAEETVAGSILIDSRSIREVASFLRPEHFYSEPCRLVYAAGLEVFCRQEPIDQITIAQELYRKQKLDVVGGAAYLSHLVAECPTSLDIEYHGAIVYRLAVCRGLIQLGALVADLGYQVDPDINRTLSKTVEIAEQFRRANALVDKSVISPAIAADQMLELITKYGGLDHSVNWGFRDLDAVTSGIFPEFIVIGARPSIGKTQLMLDVAENISQSGKTVLFVSAEMSISQIQERSVARNLGLNIRQLRKHGVPFESMGRVADLAAVVAEGNIHYLPEGSFSSDIYNVAQKMKEKGKIDIVFVDYLQLLADCWVETRENQNIRVGRACKRLLSLVKDLGIPVVCASQLSRASEFQGSMESGDRKPRKPTLSDLRDSGSIEQDADVVLLLHRDETNEDILKIQMAKNRQLGRRLKPIELVWTKEGHRYVDSRRNQADESEAVGQMDLI